MIVRAERLAVGANRFVRSETLSDTGGRYHTLVRVRNPQTQQGRDHDGAALPIQFLIEMHGVLEFGVVIRGRLTAFDHHRVFLPLSQSCGNLFDVVLAIFIEPPATLASIWECSIEFEFVHRNHERGRLGIPFLLRHQLIDLRAQHGRRRNQRRLARGGTAVNDE